MIRKIFPALAVFLALLVGCRESTSPTPTSPTPTPAPTISTFSATPAAITAGTSASLTATFSDGTGTIEPGVGSVSSGIPVPVSPLTTTTYTLKVTSTSGSVQATTTVTVVPAPQAQELRASTTTPLYGATFTLTPVYAEGTASLDGGLTCPASGVATEPLLAQWSGPRTYTLTVTNSLGATSTVAATVTPQRVSLGPVTPAGGTLTVSTSTVFSATATGGATNRVAWSSTAGTWAGATWTAPATAQDVTILATAVDDPTQTSATRVTVVDAPLATSLVAEVNPVLYGGATSLTPTFSHGTGEVDQGLGTVTSGTAFSSGPLTAARTFTLTVTNAARTQATTSLLINVTQVQMTPLGAARTKLSLTRSLAITGGQVSGAQNLAVVWLVNGVAGGNATVGTISAMGLYTAPGLLPNPGGAVTLRCQSVANPVVFRELPLTLVPLPFIESFLIVDFSPLR